MNYHIEKSKKPAYIQLYEQLRRDIVEGVYTYKSKLPSKRILAEETGASVVTAEHAYALLCEEGYVDSKEKSGYFVIFRDTDIFSVPPDNEAISPAAAFTGDLVQTLPFSTMAKIMRRTLSEYGEQIFSVSPNGGRMELKTAIAKYLARSRGIHAEPQQIIIGSGAEHLYGFIAETLGRGRIYGVEYPSYEKIEQVYRACRVEYESLPLGANGIESEALGRSKASVLHITPYRSYPSGITASASKRHEYLSWANQSDRFIVEDDFESEFTVSRKSEDTVFSLATNENVIYLNTFSKTISPSMRLGYMVLPKQLLPVYEKKLGFFSCTVPTFEQLVVAKLISSGEFERHINRIRRLKRRLLSSEKADQA